MLLKHDRGQIDYLSFGPENASSLVIVAHAAATGAQAYTRFGQLLVLNECQVVVPNLCGYGKTQLEYLETSFSVQDHVSVLEALLDQSKAENVHLIGHSMGGLVAYKFAAMRTVSSLTLIEPMIFSVLDPLEDYEAIKLDRDLVEAFHDHFDQGKAEEGIRIFIEAWNGVKWDDMNPSLRQRIIELTPQLYQESKAVTFDQQTSQDLSPACPILLMQGEDTLLPAKAIIRRLRGKFPEADFQCIKGEGHMGPLFNSPAFTAIISKFQSDKS